MNCPPWAGKRRVCASLRRATSMLSIPDSHRSSVFLSMTLDHPALRLTGLAQADQHILTCKAIQFFQHRFGIFGEKIAPRTVGPAVPDSPTDAGFRSGYILVLALGHWRKVILLATGIPVDHTRLRGKSCGRCVPGRN